VAPSRALFVLLAACGRSGFDGAGVDAPDASPTGSMVARYLMDDDPSDGVDDASEYKHDGRCTSCPTLVAARGGGAYVFDGVQTYVEVPFTPALAPSPAVTASAWIRLAAVPTAVQCIVGNAVGVGRDNSWQVCVNNSVALLTCVSYAGNSISGCQPSGNNTLQVGTWHHVAISFDGDSMRAWLDGTRVVEQQATLGQDDTPILIGADRDDGSVIGYFNGLIDDVRIWNVALAEADIVAMSAP
jgi:hypothetical protein